MLCKEWPWDKIKKVVADKGYDTVNVRNIIKTHNSEPVIPYKGIYLAKDSDLTPEDFYDIHTYRKRKYY